MDPIEKLGDEQMRELAADVFVQLEKGTAMRPVLFMLVRARQRASKAITMFIDANAEDPKVIRKLQNEIALYDDMVTSIREMLARGREADTRISENDRNAIDEIASEMSEEDRRLHGLQPRGQD